MALDPPDDPIDEALAGHLSINTIDANGPTSDPPPVFDVYGTGTHAGVCTVFKPRGDFVVSMTFELQGNGYSITVTPDASNPNLPGAVQVPFTIPSNVLTSESAPYSLYVNATFNSGLEPEALASVNWHEEEPEVAPPAAAKATRR